MREIKFRAWDKRNSRFLRHNIHIDGDGMIFWVFGYSCEYFPKEDVEIEVFTGLRDKNGKEIYEGDVLGKSSCGCPLVVEWLFGRFEARSCDSVLDRNYWKDCEVVGNIHENPELIGK